MAEESDQNLYGLNQDKQSGVSRALSSAPLQFVLIILVFVVVFGLLNYFGIVPLSRISPTFFGWLPASEKNLVSGEYNIEVVSEIPGYKVTMSNEKGLIEFLNTWGIFGRNHDYGIWGTTESVPLQTITVHLVNEDRGENPYKKEDGETYLSSSLRATSGKFDIYVYLADSILLGTERNLEEKARFITSGVIMPLYRATYPQTIDNPNPNVPTLNEAFLDLGKYGDSFFELEIL